MSDDHFLAELIFEAPTSHFAAMVCIPGPLLLVKAWKDHWAFYKRYTCMPPLSFSREDCMIFLASFIKKVVLCWSFWVISLETLKSYYGRTISLLSGTKANNVQLFDKALRGSLLPEEFTSEIVTSLQGSMGIPGIQAPIKCLLWNVHLPLGKTCAKWEKWLKCYFQLFAHSYLHALLDCLSIKHVVPSWSLRQ